MRVIGTAGHVDHGKSTLVAALTGTHPDRLKEEQEREMTIDLGFAWMTLPNGEQVGIVDVPGHRDFIENMLAGVGGIDAVLFVVAADEGVMPQTREHLAILDLLQIEAGVIALTKTDLVDDPDWLDLVEADVRTAVQGTVLADAPILRVSAKTGAGLPDLNRCPASLPGGAPAAPRPGPPAPADRPGVYHPRLWHRRHRHADRWALWPGRRGGSSAQRDCAGASAGCSRTSRKNNMPCRAAARRSISAGWKWSRCGAGMCWSHPGKYRTTRLIDVHFRLLPDASGPVRHNSEVKFFLGTAEILARVRLLGAEELSPGGEGWLQLELRDPVVAVRGDRYILRRPSPARRWAAGWWSIRSRAGATSVLTKECSRSLNRCGTARRRMCSSRLFRPPARFPSARRWRAPGWRRIRPGPGWKNCWKAGSWCCSSRVRPRQTVICWPMGRPSGSTDTARAVREVENYHRAFPLRRGMPREELKSRLKIAAARLFNAAMRRWVAEDVLEESGNLVWRPGHAVRFTPPQQAQVERLLAKFAQAPFAPPTVKEAQAEVGEDVYQALVDLGKLIPVSPDVVFRKQDYEQLVGLVRAHFAREETLTAAQFRDQLNTSRRYVWPFSNTWTLSG